MNYFKELTIVSISFAILFAIILAFGNNTKENEIKALKQENNELKIDLEISSICNDLLNIK